MHDIHDSVILVLYAAWSGLVWYIYILWVVPSDIYCTECLGPVQLVTGDLIICPLPSLERLPLPAIPPPIKSHREHTHRDETDKVVVPHKQKVLQTSPRFLFEFPRFLSVKRFWYSSHVGPGRGIVGERRETTEEGEKLEHVASSRQLQIRNESYFRRSTWSG